MQELELTWERLLAMWWLFMWRGGIGGFLIGSVLGFIVGAITGVVYVSVAGHADVPAIQKAARIAALIVSLPSGLLWGVYVLRMMLKKQYRGFRIALVANAADAHR